MSEPSRSLVEAKGSLHSSRHPGEIREMATLIRASSSSNLPPVMARSSSRLKWVKTAGHTPEAKAPAGANMPACIISWARPVLRKKVDLPPRLAPVTTTSVLASALTSLPTARPFIPRLRQGS